MTRNSTNQPRKALILASIYLSVAFVIASNTTAQAVSSDDWLGPTLTGTWAVQVTLRNCTTNVPIGSPFDSLVTFHHDGTLSESAGSTAFAPGQRGAGHGSWSQRPAHTFQQEMIALVLFDTAPNLPGSPTFDPTKPVSPGFFAGWQTVSHTVRFEDDDHIASEGTNYFYKANGDLYRSGCSTATAERVN